jgi:hypothetical protein
LPLEPVELVEVLSSVEVDELELELELDRCVVAVLLVVFFFFFNARRISLDVIVTCGALVCKIRLACNSDTSSKANGKVRNMCCLRAGSLKHNSTHQHTVAPPP